MNLNLSSLVKPTDCCLPIAKTLQDASLAEVAKPSLGQRFDLGSKTLDLSDILDGGQLPAGCFACGLAATSNLGEQFLSQFFG